MTSGMVRRGDRLLRPMGPWSPALHEYLRYLEAAGFDGAPRVLGIEGGGEVLTFIGGDVANDPSWEPEHAHDDWTAYPKDDAPPALRPAQDARSCACCQRTAAQRRGLPTLPVTLDGSVYGGMVEGASSRNSRMLEATMALVFIAIDPDTTGDHCPAVFVEEETGDLLFQGWTITDPQILSEVAQHSPVADNESVVRLPARMRAMILEALNGQGAAIRRADSRHDELGRAPGDARRVHA